MGISRTVFTVMGLTSNGFSTIKIRGLNGFELFVSLGVCGVSGISTTGDGVLVGTKSDCPVERKIPFRMDQGA